jgi:V8-like Glu-specific endopeptidase
MFEHGGEESMSNRRRYRRDLFWSGIRWLPLSLVALGCTDLQTDTDEKSRIGGTVSSALTGGDTNDVSSSTSLPASAVGNIVTRKNTGEFRSCTATVISRAGRSGNGILLSAAHCLCDTSGGIDGSRLPEPSRPG